MAKPYVPQIRMPVTLQQFTTHIIRLVSAGREDSLLEIGRIRTIEQHVLVVIRLNHQVISRSDILLHLIVHRPAIGHEYKALTIIIDAVTEAVSRVMLNTESIDGHSEQLPFLPFLEITTTGTQFLPYAIVTINTGMDLGGSVDRQFNPFTQRTYGTNMIGMVVGNQHTHNILKIQVHLTQTLLNLTRRDTRINEYSPLTRTEVVTIAATTARKAPKYEPVLLHTTKSATKVLKKNDIYKYFFEISCIYKKKVVNLHRNLCTTMKKMFLLSAIVLMITGCNSGSQVASTIAKSDPIMPIRMSGDTTHIVLTDYVPVLYGNPELWEGLKWSTADAIECVNLQGSPIVEEMDIVSRDNSLHALVFLDKSGSFAIPVLPDKPVRQNLISLGYAEDKLQVGFCEPVSNPSFEAYIQNTLIDHTLWQENEDGTWTLDLDGLQVTDNGLQGRTYLRIYAEDETYLFNDLLLPLQDGKIITDAAQLNRHDQQAQVLYSLMIDRFYNGNASNDWKMNSEEVLDIVDYQGGDIAGITAKIEEGYFDQLGVNTLWISPITQNPWDAWGCYPFEHGNKYDSSKTYTKFSGYHGYWPIYATQLDSRFATPEEFRTLLSTAHAHGINVILDYVANHMHINSPTLQEHPDWHTDSILPDGRRNFELWDEARLTTWFDKHIPTLDLERPEVCEAMTDSALYWLENYELDGYRHDACKHIPESYWRILGQKIAARWPGRHIWMIGETYGSPELIGSYVKSGMLNAQFDFNVYFTTREALCGLKGMNEVVENELTSLHTYGAHHTMGNISGNHDQIRFASIAGEAIDLHANGKEEGWTQEIGIGDAEKAYKRALLLEVINMTLPGVPCIYQGDEYGEVGANDPDNRHMMRFEGLNEAEQEMRAKVAELIQMRRSSMPLLYGDFIVLESNEDEIKYARIYLGKKVIVTINRKELSYNITEE